MYGTAPEPPLAALGACASLPGQLRGAELQEQERWEVTASGLALQLLLWVSAWGVIDAAVARSAPDSPHERFLLYAMVTLLGAVATPSLLKAQQARERAAASRRTGLGGLRGRGEVLRAGSEGLPLTHTKGVVDSGCGPGLAGGGGEHLPTAARVLVAGFAVAVCLCSGLWGMIDSTVEACSGEDNNSLQVLWYVVLTAVASAGIAVHHHFWPLQVLENVGQLTIV